MAWGCIVAEKSPARRALRNSADAHMPARTIYTRVGDPWGPPQRRSSCGSRRQLFAALACALLVALIYRTYSVLQELGGLAACAEPDAACGEVRANPESSLAALHAQQAPGRKKTRKNAYFYEYTRKKRVFL